MTRRRSTREIVGRGLRRAGAIAAAFGIVGVLGSAFDHAGPQWPWTVSVLALGFALFAAGVIIEMRRPVPPG